MNIVKIAGVQMDPRISQKAVNLDHCLAKTGEAARAGARLIVFPECSLTGYCFSSLEEAVPLAETVPGPSTRTIAHACKKLKVWVVVGLIEKAGDRFFNAAVLVGPDGIAGKYRKLHLPYLGVDRFLTRGDQPYRVYDTPAGRIGMHICYDGTFPEGCRVMALAGADIIAMPTNWPAGREKIPAFVIHTRAFENKVYYIAVDRVGQEHGTTFIGRSKIIDVGGTALAEAGPAEEVIIYAEIDLDQARQKHTVIRPGEFEFDVFKDRRPEFYGDIAKV